MATQSTNQRVAVSPWILNSWGDLILFVGTPLLIIPLIGAARERFSLADISLFVVAFGATGHHLPGMLRAYGDRELFRRFRVRFIVAPVFLMTVCIVFAYWDLTGLKLIGVTWAAWHALMQVYGFIRIYDAKFQSVDTWTSRLDFAMCLAWFGLGMLHSPGRQQDWLEMFYRSGGGLITPGTMRTAEMLGNVATAAVTIAFLMNLGWKWIHGRPASPVKLLLMVTSFGFWWYAMVGLNNLLLGLALFEIFHDVQYLAIVWVFNCKRAKRSESAGPFTKFLFRRSGVMLGLYVGLVFAYGLFFGMSPELLDIEALKPALFGMLLASGLLHFYYDGFIWKVRERSTREGLGLQGGRDEPAAGRTIPSWAVHGAKWSLFLIPAGFLASAQLQGAQPRIIQLRNLAATVPNSWTAHYKLGQELTQRGQLTEAVNHFRRAVQLNPDNAALHSSLGNIYRQTGSTVLARKQFQRAVDIDPRSIDARNNLGEIYLGRRENSEAEKHFQAVLRIAADNAVAHHGLGMVLAGHGQTTAALEHFEHALRCQPDFANAHNNLGLMQLQKNRLDAAAESFQHAIELHPEIANAHNNLAVVFVKQGKMEEAIRQYRLAVRFAPEYLLAVNSLAWNLATAEQKSLRNGHEAVRLAKRLVGADGSHDPSYLNTLAAAYAETGQFDEAVKQGEAALQLARQVKQEKLVREIGQCLEYYRRSEPYRDRSRP